uniref:Uncharacterized protein n=1 Tax=Aegilops tauschii subsp. strangulata TaxID=200361 RepID=A0A453ALJ5_AEGTS
RHTTKSQFIKHKPLAHSTNTEQGRHPTVRAFPYAASEVRPAPMLRLCQFHRRIIFLHSVPSAPAPAPAPPALQGPCQSH